MKNESNQASQIFDCPVTGQQVLTDDWRQTTVPAGWAIWWRCPACNEFHMLVVDITRNRRFHPLQTRSSSQHTSGSYDGQGLER